MKIRAPPGREESMERTKDFYNGMNYAKKQLQQREHERRRRKRYFVKQKLCGIATFGKLGMYRPFQERREQTDIYALTPYLHLIQRGKETMKRESPYGTGIP